MIRNPLDDKRLIHGTISDDDLIQIASGDVKNVEMVIILMPVALHPQPPIPDAASVHCSACDCLCWIAPETLDLWKSSGGTLQCLTCGGAALAGPVVVNHNNENLILTPEGSRVFVRESRRYHRLLSFKLRIGKVKNFFSALWRKCVP